MDLYSMYGMNVLYVFIFTFTGYRTRVPVPGYMSCVYYIHVPVCKYVQINVQVQVKVKVKVLYRFEKIMTHQTPIRPCPQKRQQQP